MEDWSPMFEPLHDPPTDHRGAHRHLLVRGDRLFVRVEHAEGTARALTGEEHDTLLAGTTDPAGHEPLVLGRLRDTIYWVTRLPDHVEPDDDHRLDGLRALHGHLADDEWNIGGRATQILDWYRDHQHCGRCGAPMERAPGERAMRCPVDGNASYPRLSPAVIVLVERDDGRALLGRSGRWDIPMFSTLAGFVEPGESLEDTVHREIREEVGVEVSDITYVASQPWPFPNSLMLGFNARWAGGEIDVDGDEIAEARWFRHDDLPMIPPHLSIARRLIDGWIERMSATS